MRRRAPAGLVFCLRDGRSRGFVSVGELGVAMACGCTSGSCGCKSVERLSAASGQAASASTAATGRRARTRSRRNHRVATEPIEEMLALMRGQGQVVPRARQKRRPLCSPTGTPLFATGSLTEEQPRRAGLRLSARSELPKATPHQEPGQTEHMMPGFSIRIPRDGNVAPYLADALHSARGWASALIRPHKTKIAPDRRGLLLSHSGRAGVSSAPPSAGTAIGPADEDPTSGTYTDGDASESIERTLTIQYRSVSFEIELRWFGEYITDWCFLYGPTAEAIDPDASEGKVSSVNRTLDLLWHGYRTAASGDEDAFHSLIKCYNLPQETDGSELFWKVGFGPAYQVYLNTLNLIYTYADLISPQVDPWCSNFSEFVRVALSNEEATSNSGRTCGLTILFKNADPRYSGAYVARGATCLKDAGCDHPSGDCAEGYDPETSCAGADWDYWKSSLSWSALSNCWSARSSGPSNYQCKEPGSGCSTYAHAEAECFSIVFHPNRQSFSGFLCDWILALARMAMDRALSALKEGGLSLSEVVDYFTAASRLGRYALRAIAELSRLYIHEMGHVLIGVPAPHCDYNCCMDVAAYGWLCQVRGRLGLPREAFYPYGTEDYSASGGRTTIGLDYNPSDNLESVPTESCSDGGPVSRSCDTVEEGRVGKSASFCMTSCRTSSGSADFTYCLDRTITTGSTEPTSD